MREQLDSLTAIMEAIRPEPRRTFTVAHEFRASGDDIVKRRIRAWATKNAVWVGIRFTSDRLTERQLVVSVKERASRPTEAAQPLYVEAAP